MTEIDEVALTYRDGYKEYLLSRNYESRHDVAFSYITMQYYKINKFWSDYHTDAELSRIADALHNSVI